MMQKAKKIVKIFKSPACNVNKGGSGYNIWESLQKQDINQSPSLRKNLEKTAVNKRNTNQ